jgi:hypothetical protein
MTIDELDRFQNDLVIVLSSDAPLELDSAVFRLRSRRQRLAQLNLYRQVVQDRCFGSRQNMIGVLPDQASEPSLDSVASTGDQVFVPSSKSLFSDELNGLPHGAISGRYKAALQTFAATRTLTPVLDGLTVRGFARQQLKRIIRWPLFYLSILVLLSSAGLYLYWIHVLPEITAFRAQSPKSDLSTGWDYQTWLPTLLVGFTVLVLMLLLVLLSGGFFRILMWMGGGRYLDLMSMATAQQIVPLLIDSGLTMEQAVLQSNELCGFNPSRGSRYLPTLRTDDPHAWTQASEYWMLIADRQLSQLKLLFPVLMMAFAGGLLLAIYGVSIYGPVVAMLRDLSFVKF